MLIFAHFDCYVIRNSTTQKRWVSKSCLGTTLFLKFRPWPKHWRKNTLG